MSGNNPLPRLLGETEESHVKRIIEQGVRRFLEAGRGRGNAALVNFNQQLARANAQQAIRDFGYQVEVDEFDRLWNSEIAFRNLLAPYVGFYLQTRSQQQSQTPTESEADTLVTIRIQAGVEARSRGFGDRDFDRVWEEAIRQETARRSSSAGVTAGGGNGAGRGGGGDHGTHDSGPARQHSPTRPATVFHAQSRSLQPLSENAIRERERTRQVMAARLAALRTARKNREKHRDERKDE